MWTITPVALITERNDERVLGVQAPDERFLNGSGHVRRCVAFCHPLAHAVRHGAQRLDHHRMPEPIFERPDSLSLAQLFD